MADSVGDTRKSDLDRLTELFTDIDIPFDMLYREGEIIVTISEGGGYPGFACSFTFDSNGKFKEHSVYE